MEKINVNVKVSVSCLRRILMENMHLPEGAASAMVNIWSKATEGQQLHADLTVEDGELPHDAYDIASAMILKYAYKNFFADGYHTPSESQAEPTQKEDKSDDDINVIDYLKKLTGYIKEDDAILVVGKVGQGLVYVKGGDDDCIAAAANLVMASQDSAEALFNQIVDKFAKHKPFILSIAKNHLYEKHVYESDQSR